MKNNRLTGKTAIITGARGGIGRAIALVLAGAGADVVLADIIEDTKLEAVADEVVGLGRESLAIKVDIASNADVEKMTQMAGNRFGKIDILVNCAGVWIPGESLLDCPEDHWDKVIQTNLRGTWLCCRAVGKLMAEQQSGNIINIASQVGLTPGTGAGAYSISKAGIIMMTRQLALELGRFNIRVNALAPGVIKTEFNRMIWSDPKIADHLATAIPLGRMADPDDVADTALFLASDDSRYVTGDILTVNGGWQPAG